jgi:hypothetical protein
MAIFYCSCKHEYQDKLYGVGRRVFNMGKANYKCTVCKSTKPLLGTEKKDAKVEEKK